jgi:hypothetical protein
MQAFLAATMLKRSALWIALAGSRDVRQKRLYFTSEVGVDLQPVAHLWLLYSA